MKRFLIIICIIAFAGSSTALPIKKDYTGYAQGTFKKKNNGTIVQYDKKGKKIGTYKNINGKFVKVK